MLVLRCWTNARQMSAGVVHPCLDRSRPVFDFAVDLDFLPGVTLDLNASGRGREVRLVCVYRIPYTHAFTCPRAKGVGSISLRNEIGSRSSLKRPTTYKLPRYFW